MYVDVNELVEVVMVFKKNKAVPALLKWAGKTYKIVKISLIHQVFDGRTRVHYFAVCDKNNYFKLAFNTDNLQWKLEQVYHEG